MHIDFAELKRPEAYMWMTTTILPRPIAWVSTLSADGKTNLAPFSFFQGITSSPPTLMFVPVNRRDGTPKDTLRNIREVPEFVVNLVSFELGEKMNATAAELPHGESEFEKFNIATAPSTLVKPPRVAASPVSFECKLDRIVRIGEGPGAGNVVFGRILALHVDPTVLDADGLPNAAKLDLVGRMGREDYSRTTGQFSIKRPDR